MDARTAGPLLRRVARLYSRLQREGVDACCGDATTAAQCMILTELGRSGPVTLADLARRVNLDKGWVSRVVEAMTRQGLLRKEPSPADRRAVIISMTAAGAHLCCNLNEMLDHQADRVMRRIPPEERPNVLRALALLERALQEELGGQPLPTPESEADSPSCCGRVARGPASEG
ncbi:MAG: MarR family transcriptional regulator [Bacillota bacterium]|nr:MAG: MarR family transcriptional regulator [Bacillota bacterium]